VGNVLLRTLLLHVGTGWSLRETAVRAKLAGVAEVSDVTLLTPAAPIRKLVARTLSTTVEREWSGLTPAIAGFPVRLVDAAS